MSEPNDETTFFQQVTGALRGVEELSTLPSIAAKVFSRLEKSWTTPAELAEIIECDPAFTMKILMLADKKGLDFARENFSLWAILEKLDTQTIHDGLFSIKVVPNFNNGGSELLRHEDLAIHCLAVGCCAKAITEMVLPKTSPNLAYIAGLLHDIGKLAFWNAMPKSFVRILEEAKSGNSSIVEIERKHLGVDHAVLGKRLAERWHLPEQITLAIWLHHSDTESISKSMPQTKIAQVVAAADIIVRQCGLGGSGSYDAVELPASMAQSLAISAEQLEHICKNLIEQVGQKNKMLGFDLPDSRDVYCDVVSAVTAKLASERSKLYEENRQLRTDASHFGFITEFLSGINPTGAAIDIAAKLAAGWQKFYQTGPVCVYLTAGGDKRFFEAAVASDNQSEIKSVILKADAAAIPQGDIGKSVILDADDSLDWLFEQLDVDFDLGQTRVVPLINKRRSIGAIVFEFRYAANIAQIKDGIKAVSSVAASVLDMAIEAARQEDFAEQFAKLVAAPVREIVTEVVTKEIVKEVVKEAVAEKGAKESGIAESELEALAEMAAGAAHELNNPLSVISGRAQLLANSETDERKQKILKQIQENTKELATIIDGLMSFAEPQQPRPTRMSVRQIIDEAGQLAALKTKSEEVNLDVDIGDNVKDVFVDSAQVVSAIANIVANSMESYPEKNGVIEVKAEGDIAGKVKVTVRDMGCGMDEETVKKAIYPFFSAKPAGRKRGMGLAYANRLIQLNKGELSIASRPGSGTTVTILLPGSVSREV
jgi:putative nucleotidyltransferase with HDIG domain